MGHKDVNRLSSRDIFLGSKLFWNFQMRFSHDCRSMISNIWIGHYHSIHGARYHLNRLLNVYYQYIGTLVYYIYLNCGSMLVLYIYIHMMKEFNLPIIMSIITVYIGPTNHAMMTSNTSYNAHWWYSLYICTGSSVRMIKCFSR